MDGYMVEMDKPFFKEFVLKCPKPVSEINETLLHDFGIVGGYDLGKVYAGRDKDMLVAVTEMNTKEEIDSLVAALKSIGK